MYIFCSVVYLHLPQLFPIMLKPREIQDVIQGNGFISRLLSLFFAAYVFKSKSRIAMVNKEHIRPSVA